MTVLRARVRIVLGLFTLLLGPRHAVASCDQIPGTANTFRGALGSVDRPFAGPGDFIEIRLSPVCDGGSPGFSATTLDHVISVVFTPPDGEANLVVLAGDCAALENERRACAAEDGVADVICRRPSQDDVEIFTRDDATALRFAFPDTDDVFVPADDGRTLTGPVRIAVSRAGSPLPCGLASRSCSDQANLVACVDALFRIDGTCDPNPHEQFSRFTALPPPNDVQALCVEPTSLCTGRAAELRMTVDTAGNLLVPMSWQGVISSRTLGIARLLNANAAALAFPGRPDLLHIPSQPFLRSFSPRGGSLHPVFEPRVDPTSADSLALFGSADAPHSVLWIARRSPTAQQCDGGSDDGRPCADAADCDGGSCGGARCVGGSAAGTTCQTDADCPAGECGPSLFDFRSRLADGVGPVVLPRFGTGLCQNSQAPCAIDADCPDSRCVTFRIAAAEPVPLEGVIESSRLLSLVVPEAIDERDLNGDGDTRDNVLLVTDRRTGARLRIGEDAAPGRAATRIHDTPFNYPAVAIADDLVAFLEAEPLQGRGDRNQDGDELDTFLRVFRAGDASIVELNPGEQRAIDAAPAINGRSVLIEDGLVWFRAREASSAPQRIARVSVASTGAEVDGRSQRPALSPDGTQIGFESDARNLANPPRGMTSYIHDRSSGITAPVTVNDANVPSNAATLSPSVSDDGRYVAVSAADRDDYSQVFVVDRDTDRDGIFDEPEATGAVQMSVDPENPDPSDGDSILPRVSPNGRFVAFLSDSTDVIELLDPPLHVVVRDRDSDEDGVFEFDATNPEDTGSNDVVDRKGYDLPTYGPPASREIPAISADGRFVAFDHFDQNIPIADVNNYCLNPGQSRTTCVDVLLKDRVTRDLDLISVSSAGAQGNNHSLSPAMSADGRFIAYFSGANTLVAGDTNDASDVFVFDRLTQTTVRVSVASDGSEGDASAYDRAVAVSADGRYVAFASTASNLVAGDANTVCDNDLDLIANDNCRDVFVHDRLTGFTERVSVAPDGSNANGQSGYPTLSADGTVVAFESQADNLIAGDTNVLCDNDFDGAADDNCQDIFVAEPDPAHTDADLNHDGDLNDTVLQLLDPANGNTVLTLGAASSVAVAGRCAVFLLPEASAVPAADLNRDGDVGDTVAHLYCHGDGAVVRNLAQAATAVALSPERIALLVNEAEQGGVDLNGDGDTRDSVVAFAPHVAPDELVNVGIAADSLALTGSRLVFAAVEDAQRAGLNRDEDRDDRVLHVVDAAGVLMNVGQAVEDFVVAGTRVAFRTSETAQSQDLSDDGTIAHAVLQVFDLDSGQLVNTRQTAIACPLSSCDPRFPYRFDGDTVRFLTLERQQGRDLTGDGHSDELVLQVFNLRAQLGEGAAAGAPTAGSVQLIGSVRAGVCADSGEACVSAVHCSDGRACLVPPGRCVVDLGTPCDLPAAFTSVTGLQQCRPDEFCVAGVIPGKGRCHVARGACDSDAHCDAPAVCQEAGDKSRQLVAPLRSGGGGSELFVDAGRCIAESDRACQPDAERSGCVNGERCVATRGRHLCQREHGSCRTEADCPPGSSCRPQLIVATAADGDGDGLADPFDNCPRAPNIDQADADGNAVGDACQVAPASATMTPTATVAATSTQTSPVATPTSVAVDEDDGSCAIGNVSSAGYRGTSLMVVVGLLLWLVRRPKSGRRFAALLVILIPAAPAFGLCRGDCDGSGVVRIDELVGLVSVALNGGMPQECAAGDSDANARITVDELVGAVDGALRGCPTVSVEDTAAAAVLMLRGLSRIHGVVGAVSAALDGVGMVLECELAGEAGATCRDVGPSVVRSTITASDCRKPIVEGSVWLDGQAVVGGIGQCPSVIMSNGLRFDFDWDMTVADDTDTPLVTSRLDLQVVLESIVSGSEPCRVKGGTAQLSGDLTYLHDEAADMSIHLDTTRTQTQLDRFTDGCDPRRLKNTLRGPITLDPAPGAPRVDLINDGLLVDVDLDANALVVTGPLRGDSFNGSARVSTLEPFDNLVGTVCFTRGALRVDNRLGSVLVRAHADGSVAVDVGADGTTDASFASCRVMP